MQLLEAVLRSVARLHLGLLWLGTACGFVGRDLVCDIARLAAGCGSVRAVSLRLRLGSGCDSGGPPPRRQHTHLRDQRVELGLLDLRDACEQLECLGLELDALHGIRVARHRRLDAGDPTSLQGVQQLGTCSGSHGTEVGFETRLKQKQNKKH